MKRITEYTFGDEHDSNPIRVTYRGDGRWAVLRNGQCLSSKDKWELEPLPSSRTSAWLDTHRFTEEAALALAEAAEAA